VIVPRAKRTIYWTDGGADLIRPIHHSPPLNQKTPSQQGRRCSRRGTTLLSDTFSRPDSLGRANERWSSPITGFRRRHLLPVWGWLGEFDLLGAFRNACRAHTVFFRLADGWSSTPAVMFYSIGLIVAYLIWIRQYW